MDKRFAISVIVGTALLAGLYLAWHAIRIELHYILSLFNHGVSTGKILFLLGFVAAVMLRVALYQKARPNTRLGYTLLIAGVLVGLSGSMAAHLQYVHVYELNLSTPTFHGRDGHLSVNSTAHIHVGKTAIAHSVELLGLGSLHDRFDTGSVYRSAVPAWLSAIIGLGFAVSVVMVIWLAPGATQRMGSATRQACTLLWALAGCALCKCILDGGPLAYDAVIAAACLWLIAAGVCRLRVAVCTAGVLGWLTVIFMIDPDLVPTQAGRGLLRGAIYLLILLFGLWLSYPKRPPLRVRAATAVAAMVVGVLVTLGWMRYVTPLRAPAEADAVVYTMTPDRGLMAETVAADASTKTIASLYGQVGENPMRPRNSSVSPRKDGYRFEIIGALHLLRTSGSALEIKPSPIAGFHIFKPDDDYAGPGDRLQFVWRVDGRTGPVIAGGINQLTQNERFVNYFLMDKVLRDAGVDEYILTPYRISVTESETRTLLLDDERE
ncbi:MAG: hypothetical protein AAGB26_15645 [Planctomycetota bacterium]